MGSINSKYLLLQPTILPKHTAASPPRQHCIYLLTFLSFFIFATLLTVFSTTTHLHPPPPPTTTTSLPLPGHVFDILLHYASYSNASGHMSDADTRAVASVLRRRVPANLLVFGHTEETPLWRALNAGGRTVFIDDSAYFIALLESRHPGLEGYDVSYTTKVSELENLLTHSRAKISSDCRPVQNLLYSDCKLAINDLPNSLYDIAWDVILVDGPRGNNGNDPGRMAAVFTAAVMARTRNGVPTEVLVHDYWREVERVCSEEFLCRENMVNETSNEGLAHFVIRGDGDTGGGFCSTGLSSSSPVAI